MPVQYGGHKSGADEKEKELSDGLASVSPISTITALACDVNGNLVLSQAGAIRIVLRPW